MIISLPYLALAAGLPFGGYIIFSQPCNHGLLLTVMQPLPFKGPGFFMWQYGNLPYAMYVVPHIGQWLLGEYLPVPLTCMLGNVTYGSGYPIVFHGSSI
jgi:hypothetical protein